MNRQIIVSFLAFLLFLSSFGGEVDAKKNLDPYKVLGVDRGASQRDIQKAFHKLSLHYHPDKNKNKGAQEKFSDINNAYEILSDEEKKRNYDLYGDESAGAGFNGGNFGGSNFGGQEGYTYFTSGGPGWQSMGGKGKSFSFSFGSDPGAGAGSFGFGLNDIFSNFFGDLGQGGNPFGGFGGFSRPSSGSTYHPKLKSVNTQTYKQEIVDQGLTWLLLFYTQSSKGLQTLESMVEDVSDSLKGAIKAGSINCQTEQSLCKNLGVWPSKSSRVFCYSYGSGTGGSLVEYTSDMDSRSLKSFCQDQLPRLSKRVTLNKFDFSSYTGGDLPHVLLLSTKKGTPVIWRTVSGLYKTRFVFLDAEASDVMDKTVKRLGVEALPAVVGRLANGEVQVLKAGFAIKDLKAGVSEISSLLDSFEKRNKKVASNQANRQSTDSYDKGILYLTSSNMDSLCGDKTTLCIIGALKSSKAKDRLEAILNLVSQKTLIRQPTDQNSRDSIRYVLLDANKQAAFLKSFDKTGFKNSDKLLLAYKPRKGKFAAFTNEITLEETEGFISSVLNGDIQFRKIQQKPVFN